MRVRVRVTARVRLGCESPGAREGRTIKSITVSMSRLVRVRANRVRDRARSVSVAVSGSRLGSRGSGGQGEPPDHGVARKHQPLLVKELADILLAPKVEKPTPVVVTRGVEASGLVCQGLDVKLGLELVCGYRKRALGVASCTPTLRLRVPMETSRLASV